MILSDRCIRGRLSSTDAYRIEISPLWSDQQIQPASVDLRLDPRHIVVGNGFREQVSGAVTLLPGQFVIASTIERIRVPRDLAAQVAGKSSLARRGVQVEAAGWVDPGFEGTITLELANLGAEVITLEPGSKICQIVFLQLTSTCERPYGSAATGNHYQGQSGPTEDRSSK